MIAEFCDETVQRAGEDPQPCGLETPCPKHREPCPRCIYSEPVAHTCDAGQQHRHRVEHQGR